MTPQKHPRTSTSGNVSNAVKPKKVRRRKFDSAWKEVIEGLFESFLEFYFSAIHEVIDFRKEVVFLDNELREIMAGTDMGDREADVLVKVFLKDGSSKYIHIIFHFEIQGQPKAFFMERMYIYNYRAFDRRIEDHNPVISAAIFTDDDPDYKPSEYGFDFCGCELRFKIPIVKILDYKREPEFRKKLEVSKNPMAIVTKAQLKSLETKKSGEEIRFETTKELIRECYREGYSREEVRLLTKFIEWVFRSSKAFERRLKEAITQIEEEYKMPYLASWEREAKKEGKKEGIEVGEKRGTDKEKIRTARKMLKSGFSIESIVDVTGLSEEKIEELAANAH